MEIPNDGMEDHSEEDVSSNDSSSESSEDEGGLNQRMSELEASVSVHTRTLALSLGAA